MITEALKDIVGKPVMVDIKSQSIYDGRLRPAGQFKTVIKSIEGPGIVLQDSSFIPWANINGIAPLLSTRPPNE